MAQALAIPLTDILASLETVPTIVVRHTPVGDGEIDRQLLHRVPGRRQVETWRLRMRPGASFDGIPHADGTHEQLIVTAGSMLAGPADDLRELSQGDSLAFDGSTPHRYVAGPDGVDAIDLLTSPATP